jgi:hypothetical protein
MKISNASSLLAAAATGLLAVTTFSSTSSSSSSSSFFAVAAVASCPGGALPNEQGSCPNPDMAVAPSEEEDSSDDEPVRSGNPNAHRMEDGEEKPPTTCESYLKLTGFKDAV